MKPRDPGADLGNLQHIRDAAETSAELVHDYFGVDLAAVWLAATQDISELLGHVQRILPNKGRVASLLATLLCLAGVGFEPTTFGL